MKRYVLALIILVSALLLTADASYAQGFSEKLKNNGRIGVGFVATHLDGLGEMTSAGPGAELYYSFNLTPNVFLSAGTGFYSVMDETFTANFLKQNIFPTFELKIGYDLLADKKFSPVVFGGFQGFGSSLSVPAKTDMVFDGSLIVGGGIRASLADKIDFCLNGDYRYVITATAAQKPSYWTVKAGVNFALNPKPNRRERINYPIDENELALDDLFRNDGTVTGNSTATSTGDPALDALFNDTSTDQTAAANTGDDSYEAALNELFSGAEDNQTDASQEDDAISLLFAGEESSSDATLNTEYPDTEVGRLMARVQELKDDITIRDREINELKDQVAANEQAIANVSRGVAGQYAGINADDTFSNITAENFKSNYQQALQKHYNKQYNEAIRQFTLLLQTMPNHKLASNCQYWIGESYNAMGQHRKAIDAFTTVLNYGSSYKYDDALIMNGLIFMKLGDKTLARDNFQQLVSKYPDSEYAPKAMRYLGQL